MSSSQQHEVEGSEPSELSLDDCASFASSAGQGLQSLDSDQSYIKCTGLELELVHRAAVAGSSGQENQEMQHHTSEQHEVQCRGMS